MKQSILALSLLAIAPSFAAGGFYCEGETHSGKVVQVEGCVSHSIPGLCGDLNVTIKNAGPDSKSFSIPRAQIPSFYIGMIGSQSPLGALALTAMDAELSVVVLDLGILYKTSEDFMGQITRKNRVKAHMTVVDGATTYKFKDVLCNME